MTTRVRPRDDEFQMPSFRLDGQVALVTGGSRGLGLGVALALAHQGADIALAARTASTLEGAAELVRKAGRRAITIEADVSNVEQVQAMVARTADELGRLDILVNNAGAARRCRPLWALAVVTRARLTAGPSTNLG
jgi:NAD(P)-dependent dehydrogenase (short-subunit alcohol dehydrogenase family)